MLNLLILASTAMLPDIDVARAAQYFAEARALSDRDAGKLWDKPLYGPMLFVDPGTMNVITNAPDADGKLTKEGDLYRGSLPQGKPTYNGSFEWQGTRWTMLRWPLPQEQGDRGRLMMHELFHRVQTELGLPPSNTINNHLETMEGRYWLQLEWRALRAALTSRGKLSRQAGMDALLFRGRRRELFKEAAKLEGPLEMNEGMAEYTGVRLAFPEERAAVEYTLRQLDAAATRPSFVRSFAYATGPAYGLLLDRVKPSWNRKAQQTDDLAALLASASKLPAPGMDLAQKRAEVYDGLKLRASEETREQDRQVRMAEYRRLLVDGPVLEIPLKDSPFSFDPNNVLPLEGVGTVYPTMTVSGPWGGAEVTKGALVSADFNRLYLPKPVAGTGGKIQGEGWEITPKSGWAAQPGGRPGDLRLVKL